MPRQLERHNLRVLMTTRMEATQRATKKSRIWAVTTTGRTSHHLRSSREMEKVRVEARASTKAKAKAKAKVKTRAKGSSRARVRTRVRRDFKQGCSMSLSACGDTESQDAKR